MPFLFTACNNPVLSCRENTKTEDNNVIQIVLLKKIENIDHIPVNQSRPYTDSLEQAVRLNANKRENSRLMIFALPSLNYFVPTDIQIAQV